MNNVAKKISLLALALPTLVACVAEPLDADPTGSDAAALQTDPGAAGRATQAENDCVDGVYRGEGLGYWKAGVTFQCKLGGGSAIPAPPAKMRCSTMGTRWLVRVIRRQRST